MSQKDVLSVKNTHGMPFEPLPVWLPAPRRRPIQQVPGGRRPVVAMLDTGVADHDWFETADPADPILVRAGEATGTNWHGTFVAGLIRQSAPDARVLSLPLERTGDGRIASGQLAAGLTRLLADPDGFVDVICVAVGFREVEDDDENRAEQLADLIRQHGSRGTLVVAAAGNKRDGANGPVYPAALASPGGEPPLIAVGAVDPAGAVAQFSVTGDWVTRTYVGVEVISPTPVMGTDPWNVDDWAEDVASVVTPETYVLEESQHGHAFGRGCGTSYAAAGFAGLVAQAMLDTSDGVSDVSPEGANRRVRQALGRIP